MSPDVAVDPQQHGADRLGAHPRQVDAGHAGLEPPRRGHNRTWRGSILREMRQVGSTDPVFVLDEIEVRSRLSTSLEK